MNKWDKYFIKLAIETASMSESKRLQVGAVAVLDKRIVCTGFNGTVSKYGDDELEDENGVTKPDVIHAEENLICQAALQGKSLQGCTVYLTHNPCRHCCALLGQVGIRCVKYLHDYRDLSGLLKLKQYEIRVEKLNYEN